MGCSLAGRVAQSLSLVSPTPSATAIPSPTPTATPVPAAYVPPQCDAVALATIPAATTVALPTPALVADPPLTTEDQLAVLDAMAPTIADVYLYPEVVDGEWQSVVAAARARIESGLETEAFYQEMNDLVNALGDEHSQFESPAVAAASQAELAGSNDFVGIGVLVQPLPEKGRVTILTVFPESPAAFGGLQPHDSILAVDSVPLVESGVAYPQRMRGPECSATVLTIQSPGQAPRDVTFVRERVTAALPIDARLVPTTDGKGIGYIFIPTFFDQTITDQVRQALQDFGPLDGLILDNRMNGGGSSTVVERMLGFFTSGIVGHFVSLHGERPLEVLAEPIYNSQDVPLVVLVAKDTVSFGEIFSGALHDLGRSLTVGQTTLGNVETLHGYNLPDGSTVWIAEERFDPLYSDDNWEALGIMPDLEIIADWDTFTFESDPAIAAALVLLGH